MSSEKNRYWIPNLDINKKVITQEIQYYLGPESTVRPYTREVLHLLISIRNSYWSDTQGEDGFLITTPGECLTDVSPLWLDSIPVCCINLHRRSRLTISAASLKKYGRSKQLRVHKSWVAGARSKNGRISSRHERRLLSHVRRWTSTGVMLMRWLTVSISHLPLELC